MAQTAASVPLTDLCAICHVNPIKYTCPRDGIHTCSLTCVKRHKQWAQCSGIRDPAEYRKRSELATATSFDKDFNFITKVERSISRADDVVADKGIDLVPARIRPHDARPKLEVEAESRGIKLIKAPKGLSRSKQNRSHWAGQPKCIVWTVEWLCSDGRKIMSGSQETKSIKDLFGAAAGNKRNSRKRKRPSDAERAPTQSRFEDPSNAQPDHEHESKDIKASQQQSQSHSVLTTPSDPRIALKADGEIHLDVALETHSIPEFHFYLYRPNTESRFKCLIPLSPTASLQESLTRRTIIEFPTIHVRNEPPEQLEAPFITEDEYIQRHGVDIPINVAVPTEASGEDADGEEGEVTSIDNLQGLSESKVLEVLAKDLGS